MTSEILTKEYFNKDTLSLAKDLIGKKIIRNKAGISYEAMIVETEAYLGIADRAAHSFNNRKTERTKIMYMDKGTIYVYQTYGIHFLLNFVTMDEGVPEAVLIRGVEPITNINQMSLNRFGKNYDELSNYQKKNITNGPGKLTQAMEIDKALNGKNLFTDEIYLTNYDINFDIIVDKRIGIDYAKEAIAYPYRFYMADNKYVSVLKKEE